MDELLEVSPGGETRLVLSPEGDHSIEGHIGPVIDPDTMLYQASELLPAWLRGDFIRNMLKTGSAGLYLGVEPKASFGDLDGDGDDDMITAVGDTIFFFKNIGRQGNPVFDSGGFGLYEDGYKAVQTAWVSPTIFDLDGNEFGDVIYGDDDYLLNFLMNPLAPDGPTEQFAVMYVGSSFPPTHLSPTVWYMDTEELIFILGSKSGTVYHWSVEPNVEDGRWGFNMNGAPQRIDSILPSLNMSAPRAWNTLTSEGRTISRSLAVGSAEGATRFFTHSGEPASMDGFESVPGYFANVVSTAPATPAPADLNGDREPDLVIDRGGNFMMAYPNLGFGPEPYWIPDPHLPAFEIENYESAFDDPLEFYYEDSIIEYLEAVIEAPDPRYRDEIGFACAFTPPSQLRDNRLADLLAENVWHIYSRDPHLEYVRLVEHTDGNAYTTAAYRVRVGERIVEMEIPREAYYWGIVHPRVTEEIVAYIDPETGGQTAPENGGRYWREYLWEHADEEYPPGPVYPDEWTGPRAYYPRNSTPPLLKDVLKDVDILWDMQPYEYPRGFDNQGEVNDHPWNLRDHAVEKVSHWVEKTLVINQQESPDSERPNQPVRIAHGHNGNCGELQDLTIAAARSALIPSRGVHLTGEDHVWSEFYLGGWHQWDNYWSDSGGVVANDLNYWWGWGARGGSGVWASDGAGQSFDVGDRYRSPDVRGYLQVNVLDSEFQPVDGARVVVFSHWVMENAVDPGPYQGPLPTIPLPSIWNYTDQDGKAEFMICRQNFHFRVTSDLGTYVSDKFTIDEQIPRSFTVQLQASRPPVQEYQETVSFPESGKGYLLSVEVLDSYQDQRDFTSGVLFRNRMDNCEVKVSLISGNAGERSGMLMEEVCSGDSPLIKAFMDGGRNITVSISDEGSIKTHSRVRIRVFELEGETGSVKDVIPANPEGPGGSGFQLNEFTPLKGWLLYPDEDLDPDSTTGWIGTEMGDVDVEVYKDKGAPEGVYSWETSRFGGSPAGINRFSFNLQKNGGESLMSVTMDIRMKDEIGPRWSSLVGNGTIPWGSVTEMGALYDHPRGMFKAISWINDELVWSADSEIAGYHRISKPVDTSRFTSGAKNIRLTAWDEVGNIQTLVYRAVFDPVSPWSELSSPIPGQKLPDDSLPVKGIIGDDVEVVSFVISVEDRQWDLADQVDGAGTVDTVIDLLMDPGELNVEVNITDNVGLWNSTRFSITVLPPPDVLPPSVEIESPDDGAEIQKGEVLRFRGTAFDSSGLDSLVLTAGAYRADLIPVLIGKTFALDVDTSTWSTGQREVVLRAVDNAGNIGTDRLDITILDEEPAFIDRESPEIIIMDPHQGASIQLGSSFIIRGRVTEDSGEADLFLSIDQGESYVDITDLMGGDLSFEIGIETGDILNTYDDISPQLLFTEASDHDIILRAVDGSRREDTFDLAVSIVDVTIPEVGSGSAAYDEESGGITVALEADDDSMVAGMEIRVENDDGIAARTGRIPFGELRESEGVFAAEWRAEGPFEPGDYQVIVEVADAWGNTAFKEMTVNVPEEKGEEESSFPQLLVIGLILLVIIPIALYGAVRLKRLKPR
ncbi:MAG: transglutaminase domain-containing protein [Thermoplasmatota archaeon]